MAHPLEIDIAAAVAADVRRNSRQVGSLLDSLCVLFEEHEEAEQDRSLQPAQQSDRQHRDARDEQSDRQHHRDARDHDEADGDEWDEWEYDEWVQLHEDAELRRQLQEKQAQLQDEEFQSQRRQLAEEKRQLEAQERHMEEKSAWNDMVTRRNQQQFREEKQELEAQRKRQSPAMSSSASSYGDAGGYAGFDAASSAEPTHQELEDFKV